MIKVHFFFFFFVIDVIFRIFYELTVIFFIKICHDKYQYINNRVVWRYTLVLSIDR